MPDPINYTSNPMPQIMQMLQTGNMLGQMGAQRDARQAAEAAAAEEARRQQELRDALEAAHANPTAENYVKLADFHAAYNPDKAKAFRDNWATLDASQQRNALNESVGMLSALSTDPEIAKAKLMESIEAETNAKNPEGAKKYQTMLDLINVGDRGLQGAKDSLIMTIGLMPGGKEAIEGLAKFGEEQRAAAAEPDVIKKRLVDIGYTEAQTVKVLAEARKYNLDADKMASEIERAKNALPPGREISAGAEKLVNDSVIAAAKANALKGQYATLAGDFEKAISTAGVGARVSEQISKLLGTEKDPTALRQEYLRMRNTAVLDMLPPGVASDKDIELALAAFPTETSSPANIAGFLRGMAKLQAYEAALESSKAEWIQQNGTLGTASVPMMVGNREVKPGERFTEFIQMYIPNTSVLGTGGAAGASFGTGGSGGSGGTPAAAAAAEEPVVEGDF